MGLVRAVAIAPVTLWRFHLYFYGVHRARMGKYIHLSSHVWNQYEPRRSRSSPVIYDGTTVTQIVLRTGNYNAVWVRLVLCWHPVATHIGVLLRLFWTFQYIWEHSLHWRLIKLVLGIKPDEIRFATITPNGEHSWEKCHSVTWALLYSISLCGHNRPCIT